jgi:hypothetical protein
MIPFILASKTQLRPLLAGASRLDESELACRLKIANYLSAIFQVN